MRKPKKAHNRGQLKIQQMAFMLMAVTLFFVLAGVFVLVIRFSGVKKSAEILEEENAMLLISKLANSPEFSCGESFGGRRTNCVDADKVMVLKESIGKYFNFWGVSNIEIRKIYPKTSEVKCSLGNYPKCNTIQVISGEMAGVGLSNFVSLCRKESLEGEVYDKCELAKIVVTYKGK